MIISNQIKSQQEKKGQQFCSGNCCEAEDQRKWAGRFRFDGRIIEVLSKTLKIVIEHREVPIDEYDYSLNAVKANEEEDQTEGRPNNDFCWTEDDFLDDLFDGMNEARRRHSNVFEDACSKIQDMVDSAETISSSADGKII